MRAAKLITIRALQSSAVAEPEPCSVIGPIQLLILQPTPFCNIDCRYCYLPNRSETRTMDLGTVLETATRIAEEGLLGESITIVWHAGEPLTLPKQFYVDAISGIRGRIPASTVVRHTVQTNGTLLNDGWCELFAAHGVRVGLSLDGPQSIHDAARITRSGKGTFTRVMRGLELLRDRNIPYYVLAVLTAASLQHADKMFEFFRSNNVPEVGFNVEEIEGIHLVSSLTREFALTFRQFMSAFYSRCAADPGAPRIREFRQLEGFLLNGSLSKTRPLQQLTPYRILSVDCDGGFSTFSPELLGMKGPPASDYTLGNIHTDGLRNALTSPKFHSIYSSLMRGVSMCREGCDYFGLCGCGSPSNKISEHGTLEATETLHCFLRIKQLTEVVLVKLEERYGLR